MSNKICSVEGCNNKYYAKGLCSRHYLRKTEELVDNTKSLPGEIWKDVNGFTGLYQVSNFGRVKSLPHTRMRRYRTGDTFPYRVNGFLLVPQKSPNGYLQVTLHDGVNIKLAKIHRIVCIAFHGMPPNGKTHVNHKDGNKENNTPENLEWCSQKENNIHAQRVLRRGLIPIYCVETGQKFQCSTDADRLYGLSYGAISKVIRGDRKTAGGYHWKKIEV